MTRRLLAASVLAVLAGCGGHGSKTPRLFLLITVDTLRADHLGAYGAPAGSTPELDRLAAQSVVFENAYAVASCTLPSLGGLMTSRYPEEIGVQSNMSTVVADATTLASSLAARGFRTGGVVSNPVLRPESGIGAGFELYDARFRQLERVRGLPERSAPHTTRAALAMLGDLVASGADRLFLWVHYQDPHGPYTPPPPFDARFSEPAGPLLAVNPTESGVGGIPNYQSLNGRREAGYYRARYKGEIAYADDAIGHLLRGVDRRGLLDDAIVVFAADHGEGMGEDDYWFAHGERLSDPLVHVPLLLRVPGRAPGRRADVASLLDVFPTVVALAGGGPVPAARGRDLLAPAAAADASTVYQSTLRVARVPQRALIARGWRYLVEDAAAGVRETVSPLSGGATPASGLLEDLRGALQRLRGGLRQPQAEQRALTPADEEALKALGYVSEH